MKLDEKRAEWERGLEVKTVIDRGDPEVLVVLESTDAKGPNRYHCHRYFQIGADWEVSTDGQRVSLDLVWAWLAKPCAAACRPIGG